MDRVRGVGESKEGWMPSKVLSCSSMHMVALFTKPADTTEGGPGMGKIQA